MAKKITDLVALTSADSTDVLPIVDVSANTTKKVTVDGLIATGSITPAKIAAQQAWQSVTYIGAWTTYGSGYPAAQYMKDSLGFVHLRGLVKSGQIGTSVFTLPAGYRPGAKVYCITASNGSVGILDVTTAGDVVPGSGSNVLFSLENVIFKAEG